VPSKEEASWFPDRGRWRTGCDMRQPNENKGRTALKLEGVPETGKQ
jgi:hypothetical protein